MDRVCVDRVGTRGGLRGPVRRNIGEVADLECRRTLPRVGARWIPPPLLHAGHGAVRGGCEVFGRRDRLQYTARPVPRRDESCLDVGLRGRARRALSRQRWSEQRASARCPRELESLKARAVQARPERRLDLSAVTTRSTAVTNWAAFTRSAASCRDVSLSPPRTSGTGDTTSRQRSRIRDTAAADSTYIPAVAVAASLGDSQRARDRSFLRGRATR